MSLTYKVTDLIPAVRQRADIEGQSQIDRFPDTELVGYLNRAYGAWYRLMNDARGGNYNVTSTTVTTTANTSVYALQVNFWKLLHVIVTLNGRKEWIIPFDENERAYLSDQQAGWTGAPFRYSLVGQNLEFLPIPATAYTIEVRYVPNPYQFVSAADTTTVDVVSEDGHNYIVDVAAKYAAEKNSNWNLAQSIGANIQALDAAIRASVPNRDMNAPPRIQDVRGVYGGYRNSRRWRFV